MIQLQRYDDNPTSPTIVLQNHCIQFMIQNQHNLTNEQLLGFETVFTLPLIAMNVRNKLGYVAGITGITTHLPTKLLALLPVHPQQVNARRMGDKQSWRPKIRICHPHGDGESPIRALTALFPTLVGAASVRPPSSATPRNPTTWTTLAEQGIILFSSRSRGLSG